MLGADDDADHDRALVAIVPPTVCDTVDDQPVAGCQADLGVFEHEDSFTGELHQGVDGSGRMQYCEARMAYFMIPRYVRVVEALPKTGTERTIKYQLKAAGVTPDTWDREAAGYEIKRAR